MSKHGCVQGAVLAGLFWVLSVASCGGEEDKPEAEKPPVLGLLELPVSLRSGDAAPGDARKVEVGQSEVRIDGQTVIALENGKVPAGERSGDAVPKLKSALQTPSKSAIALHMSSNLPYETLALVLDSASSAGIRDVAFQVRKPGGSTETGWMLVKAYQMTPRTDDAVAIGSVDARKWDEFATAWEEIHNACRGSESGSCAYVPSNPAKGGDLKIVLFAAGQGVNVNFFRVGLSAEELAAEAKALEAANAMAKEDVVQGRKKQTDVAAELEAGPPATEALFQFRANEALKAPSALSETLKPLCGNRACGAVVSAEPPTLAVRVVSLIGAAFPDGAAPPVLAFEQPWTEKSNRQPAEAAK